MTEVISSCCKQLMRIGMYKGKSYWICSKCLKPWGKRVGLK